MKIGLGVAIGFFLSVWFYGFFPHFNVVIGDAFGDSSYSGEKLVFEDSHKETMNNVFLDKEEEYAWCLDIDGENVDSLDFTPETAEASMTHVVFRCNFYHEGHVHTHPGVWSVPYLSDQDKRALVTSDFDVACVMSDPIRGSVNPSGFNCFENPVDSGLDPDLDEDEVEDYVSDYDFEEIEVYFE